jgi:hypothetical protein
MPAPNINDDIDAYLDATAGIHGGVNSKKFAGYLKKLGHQDGFVRVTKVALADLMKISRQTLDDYIDRYNRKHAQRNDRSAV